MRSFVRSRSARASLVGHLRVEGDLVLLGQLDGDLEASDHGPADGPGQVRGLDRRLGLLEQGDGLVGIDLHEPPRLGDLGADLGVEPLRLDGHGVHPGVEPAGGGLVAAGELQEQVLDALGQVALEGRGHRGDLVEHRPGPVELLASDGDDRRLVELQRRALLGEIHLGEQLLGVVAGTGLGGAIDRVAGRGVIAAREHRAGLVERDVGGRAGRGDGLVDGHLERGHRIDGAIVFDREPDGLDGGVMHRDAAAGLVDLVEHGLGPVGIHGGDDVQGQGVLGLLRGLVELPLGHQASGLRDQEVVGRLVVVRAGGISEPIAASEHLRRGDDLGGAVLHQAVLQVPAFDLLGDDLGLVVVASVERLAGVGELGHGLGLPGGRIGRGRGHRRVGRGGDGRADLVEFLLELRRGHLVEEAPVDVHGPDPIDLRRGGLVVPLGDLVAGLDQEPARRRLRVGRVAAAVGHLRARAGGRGRRGRRCGAGRGDGPVPRRGPTIDGFHRPDVFAELGLLGFRELIAVVVGGLQVLGREVIIAIVEELRAGPQVFHRRHRGIGA